MGLVQLLLGFSAQPRAEQNVTQGAELVGLALPGSFSAQPRAEQNVTERHVAPMLGHTCFSAQPRAEQNVTDNRELPVQLVERVSVLNHEPNRM